MNSLSQHRNLVLSLLKDAPEPVPVSDIWHALRHRKIDVPYYELEGWLLEQVDAIEVALDGGVRLRPGFDASSIRRSARVPRPGEGTDVDAATRLHRLVAYYRDCLQEEGRAVRAYRGRENASFVVLDRELACGAKPYASVRTTDCPDFVRNVFGDQQRVVYGYPLLLEWVESGDGEFADFKVTPVFIMEVTVRQEPEKVLFVANESWPRLNPQIVLQSPWKDRRYVQEQLDGDRDRYSSHAQRVALLPAVLPQFEAREELDPVRVGRAGALSLLKRDQEGFYNRPVLMRAETSKYTRGLMAELELLGQVSEEEFAKTALAALIRSAEENGAEEAPGEPIRVFASGSGEHLLNADQEHAVREAFKRRLSVVTGPPGTGKSQVVTALISSAVLHGRSVLFASRNHKALEVVQERMLRICPSKHGLVRVGGEYDLELRQILDQMGNLPATEQTVAFSRQMDSIQLDLEELDRIEEEQERVIAALGETGVAEERFNAVRHRLMPGVEDAHGRIRDYGCEALLDYARRLDRWLRLLNDGRTVRVSLALLLAKHRGQEMLKEINQGLQAIGIQTVLTWPAKRTDLAAAFREVIPVGGPARSCRRR